VSDYFLNANGTPTQLGYTVPFALDVLEKYNVATASCWRAKALLKIWALVHRDDVENQASLSVSVLEDTTDTSARLGRTPNQLFDNASPW